MAETRSVAEAVGVNMIILPEKWVFVAIQTALRASFNLKKRVACGCSVVSFVNDNNHPMQTPVPKLCSLQENRFFNEKRYPCPGRGIFQTRRKAKQNQLKTGSVCRQTRGQTFISAAWP